MQKNGPGHILLLIGSALIIIALSINRFFVSSLNDIALNTEIKITDKVAKNKKKLKLLLDRNKTSETGNDNRELCNWFTQETTGLYLFEKDSLVFWNNSQIPIEADIKLYPKQEGV